MRIVGLIGLCGIGLWLAFTANAENPSATVQVPVNSQFLGADGKTYTLSGTLSLTTADVTPPPPNDLKVSYLTMSPPAVTAGQSATVTVQMSKAWTTAVVVSLLSADPIAQVPASLTVPAGLTQGFATVTTTGPVTTERLVAISAKYGSSGGYSNLRVLPGNVVPPVPPVPPVPVPIPVPNANVPGISDYLNADGTPLVGLPAFGQVLRLSGDGFGTTAGRVAWNGAPVTVEAWGETEVRVKLPQPSVEGGQAFDLMRADGVWYSGMIAGPEGPGG